MAAAPDIRIVAGDVTGVVGPEGTGLAVKTVIEDKGVTAGAILTGEIIVWFTTGKGE